MLEMSRYSDFILFIIKGNIMKGDWEIVLNKKNRHLII